MTTMEYLAKGIEDSVDQMGQDFDSFVEQQMSSLEFAQREADIATASLLITTATND